MEFAARLRSAEGQVMDMRTWISRVLHPRIPVIRLQDAPRDSSGRVMWTSVPPLQPVQPMALQPPCPSPTSHPSLPTKLEAGGQEVVTTQPVTPPAPVSPPCSRPLMAVPVCERVWGPWRSSPPHPGVHTWRRDSSEWAGKAVQLPPSSPSSLGHHSWMSSPVAAPSRQRANVQVSVCVACGKTVVVFLAVRCVAVMHCCPRACFDNETRLSCSCVRALRVTATNWGKRPNVTEDTTVCGCYMCVNLPLPLAHCGQVADIIA